MARRTLVVTTAAIAIFACGDAAVDSTRAVQQRAFREVIAKSLEMATGEAVVLCVSLEPLPTDPPPALVAELDETLERVVPISQCLYGPDEVMVRWQSQPAVAIWVGEPRRENGASSIEGGYYENPTSSANFVCTAVRLDGPVECMPSSVS